MADLTYSPNTPGDQFRAFPAHRSHMGPIYWLVKSLRCSIGSWQTYQRSLNVYQTYMLQCFLRLEVQLKMHAL